MISRDACVARDCVDPLRGLRDRFVIPEGIIYLDGNSLGPMPRAAAAMLNRTIEQEWGQDLIRSWNTAGWFDMPVRLGDRVGALLGAAPGQTLVCDTTSINLYKAIHAAIGLRPDRNVVIAEDESFPTDLYIVEGAMKSAGRPMTASADRHGRPVDRGAAGPRRRGRRALACQLSHRRVARHGRHHQAAARRRRAGGVGSLPFDRRGGDRVRPSCGRFRGRLHLQIPERRSGISGLHCRRQNPPGRRTTSIIGLVGSCRPFRLRSRLPARCRHQAIPLRNPADHLAARRGCGARCHGRASRSQP